MQNNNKITVSRKQSGRGKEITVKRREGRREHCKSQEGEKPSTLKIQPLTGSSGTITRHDGKDENTKTFEEEVWETHEENVFNNRYAEVKVHDTVEMKEELQRTGSVTLNKTISVNLEDHRMKREDCLPNKVKTLGLKGEVRREFVNENINMKRYADPLDSSWKVPPLQLEHEDGTIELFESIDDDGEEVNDDTTEEEEKETVVKEKKEETRKEPVQIQMEEEVIVFEKEDIKFEEQLQKLRTDEYYWKQIKTIAELREQRDKMPDDKENALKKSRFGSRIHQAILFLQKTFPEAKDVNVTFAEAKGVLELIQQQLRDLRTSEHYYTKYHNSMPPAPPPMPQPGGPLLPTPNMQNYNMNHQNLTHQSGFKFTYPVRYYEDVEFLGFTLSRTYHKKTEDETIPFNIKSVLLPLVEQNKSYNFYRDYMFKAKDNPTVRQWLDSATTQDEINKRLLKIQRFWWVDHKIVGEPLEQVEAMHDQLYKQRKISPSYVLNPFKEYSKIVEFVLWLCFALFTIGLAIYSGKYAIGYINGVHKHVATVLEVTLWLLVFNAIVTFFRFLNRNLRYDPERIPQLMLFDETPALSIYIEEIIKLMPLGIDLVGYLEMNKYGTWQNYHLHHKLSKIKGFFNRVNTHFEWNEELWRYYSNKKNTKGLKNYLSHMNVRPDCFTSVPNTLTEHYFAAILQNKEFSYKEDKWEAIVTSIPCAQKPIYPEGTKKHRQEFYIGWSEGVYPIFMATTNLRKPANVPENIDASIECRLLQVNPPKMKTWVPKWCENRDHWLPEPRDGPKYCTEKEKEEWMKKLLPKQRARIIQDRIMYEHRRPDRVNLLMKGDELLKFSNKKYVPRNLFDMSGWWLDKMGIYIDDLTEMLKKKFDCYGRGKIEAPSHSKYRIFVPYFACGATSKELAIFRKLMNNAPDDEFWFMVMGDDTASKLAESDFSKFDRTQDYELIKWLIRWCYDAGYIELAEAWLHQYKVVRRASHKKSKWGRKIGWTPGKMTGENPTCWSNSVFNIFSTIYAHQGLCTKQDIVDRYADFGFEVKYQIPKYVSFLKGFFLPGLDNNDMWMRAPSFLGKFGKTLKNWFNTTHIGESLEQKAANALWSQWLGYGEMRNNWFYNEIHVILKDLCSRILRGNLPGAEKHLEVWQVLSDDHNSVPNDVFDDFIQWRYGLNHHDLEDCLQLFKQINTLPVIYNHYVVHRFTEVDY